MCWASSASQMWGRRLGPVVSSSWVKGWCSRCAVSRAIPLKSGGDGGGVGMCMLLLGALLVLHLVTNMACRVDV